MRHVTYSLGVPDRHFLRYLPSSVASTDRGEVAPTGALERGRITHIRWDARSQPWAMGVCGSLEPAKITYDRPGHHGKIEGQDALRPSYAWRSRQGAVGYRRHVLWSMSPTDSSTSPPEPSHRRMATS